MKVTIGSRAKRIINKALKSQEKGERFEFSYNFNEEYYRNLKQILNIKRVKDFPFVRVGKNNDGGYIMVDNFDETQLGGGIAYSFGISNDVSWDISMVNRGYDIYMYDPTIDRLLRQHEKFHFFKEGIAGKKDTENSMDTLENFIKRNGHENKDNMILKMDVEGAEWGFLETVPSEILNKFDQMVFEFHGFIQPKTFFDMTLTIELLKKINFTHTLVHVHANNNSSYLKIENLGTISNLLELTYLNNEKYDFIEDENILLPIKLDQPCVKDSPDTPLGYWNRFI